MNQDNPGSRFPEEDGIFMSVNVVGDVLETILGNPSVVGGWVGEVGVIFQA